MNFIPAKAGVRNCRIRTSKSICDFKEVSGITPAMMYSPIESMVKDSPIGSASPKNFMAVSSLIIKEFGSFMACSRQVPLYSESKNFYDG